MLCSCEVCRALFLSTASLPGSCPWLIKMLRCGNLLFFNNSGALSESLEPWSLGHIVYMSIRKRCLIDRSTAQQEGEIIHQSYCCFWYLSGSQGAAAKGNCRRSWLATFHSYKEELLSKSRVFVYAAA